MSKSCLATLGIVATTVVLADGCGGGTSSTTSNGKAASNVEQSATSTVTASGTKASIVVVTAGKPSEYEFQISPTSVKHGTVIFKITNLGKLPHGFSINGHASKVLPSHKSTTLTVVFKKPSRYVYNDPCVVAEAGDTTPCGGGVLKIT
jgi:hypothetical protein